MINSVTNWRSGTRWIEFDLDENSGAQSPPDEGDNWVLMEWWAAGDLVSEGEAP